MKRRINMIIGKKQIILASLTLILGIAIYLNYVFSQGAGDLVETGKLENTESNYGDAQFVSGAVNDEKKDSGGDEYFAQARLDKMKSRDEAVETLQSFFKGGDLTKDELAIMTSDAVNLSTLIESENKIETLIKAQGFEDCLVYLDGTSANIIVRTEGLEPAQAAQIKDALLGEVSVDSEFITILEVK